MKTSGFLSILAIALLLPACVINAEEANISTGKKTEQAKLAKDVTAVSSITVAIFDFESKAPAILI